MRHSSSPFLIVCALCLTCVAASGCGRRQAMAESATVLQDYCNKSPGIADGAIVIRGGLVNAETLAEGGDVGSDGYMTDLSVNCSGAVDAPNDAPNRQTYRAGIPNAQYGVTSARKVCQAGGYLSVTPYPGHRYHCTLWHLKPKQAASLFTQY